MVMQPRRRRGERAGGEREREKKRKVRACIWGTLGVLIISVEICCLIM